MNGGYYKVYVLSFLLILFGIFFSLFFLIAALTDIRAIIGLIIAVFIVWLGVKWRKKLKREENILPPADKL